MDIEEITEAIKRLEQHKRYLESLNALEQVKAHQLGIEALKRMKACRRKAVCEFNRLLPGETRERGGKQYTGNYRAKGGRNMIEKCPVCLGNGLVPNGFYSTTRQEGGCLVWTSGGTEPEICLSCDGKGYVVEPLVKETK